MLESVLNLLAFCIYFAQKSVTIMVNKIFFSYFKFLLAWICMRHDQKNNQKSTYCLFCKNYIKQILQTQMKQISVVIILH